MRYLAIILTVACSIGAVSVQADAPAAQAGKTAPLPAVVAADLQSVANQCREVGGTPQAGDAVKRVDLNGDGNEDFVLDVGAVNCDGAASIYGDREKGVTVYAGDGHGGAVSVFSESVFGAKIEGTGASTKLWLTVSGAQCGKKPARDFASETFCDRPLVWNATSKKFEYAPVAAVRIIQ